MKRQCSKKGCEFEVDYACECLSLQTYWCQFHLGEHLKLSNRTHACDIIIAEPSQKINDSIFDFLEREKFKIEKLKEIALYSLSPNLYNSKISIEETFKKLDYSLKEINGLIKKITESLKKSKDFNVKELNNSELYNAKLCFILDHLKTKKSKILKSVYNEPNAEKDFRRICWLYENSSSDPLLDKAYHEYVEAHDKLTPLYLIDKKDDERSNLYIFNTESESEGLKVLEISQDIEFDEIDRITLLPNGELFCSSKHWNAYIIDKNYKTRKLPSCQAHKPGSSVYFNRSVYCFGGHGRCPTNVSIRFDLEKNRWFQLSPMIEEDIISSSVIFNGNILMTRQYNPNILLYSIDIDSFSDIPCDSGYAMSKIMIKAEKRLYLIHCGSGPILESDIDDGYTWKWIARSKIHISRINQFYCSYNKGGIYISISTEKIWNQYTSNQYSLRQYFKFDLTQKALIEIAHYNEYATVKRSSSKHGNIECYSKTLKYDPYIATAYINKGHSLYDLDDLIRKIEHLNEKITPNYDYFNPYCEKADALCELGKSAEAVECFSQAIKFTRKMEAYYKKAQILCEAGREVEAIDCYNKIIKKIPTYAKNYVDKGYALCKFKRYFEAIECCNEAIKIDSKDLRAYLCIGDALNSSNKKSEAIECYNQAIRLYPSNLNAYFYKGKILSELGKDFELIECCSEAIIRKSDDLRFYILKGKAFSQMGRKIEKNECYNKVIKALFDAKYTYFKEAFIECDLETKIEALESYNEKIKSDLYNEEAYIRKGYALYHLDRKIEAIQCYNKLFKIGAKNKIKYIKDILDLPNYYKLFETRIEKAIVGTMNEEDLHFLDWIIELIERYSEEIEMKSLYAYAYALKGCTLHLAGKYLEEIEFYDKANSINPDMQTFTLQKMMLKIK